MSWIKITTTDNIPLREGRAVKIGRREIAIFHLADRFVAVDNLCPHNQGPLADGIVKGDTVVCPLHGWNICLDSGRVCRPDLPISVRTYPTRVSGDVVEIEVAADCKEAAA